MLHLADLGNSYSSDSEEEDDESESGSSRVWNPDNMQRTRRSIKNIFRPLCQNILNQIRDTEREMESAETVEESQEDIIADVGARGIDSAIRSHGLQLRESEEEVSGSTRSPPLLPDGPPPKRARLNSENQGDEPDVMCVALDTVMNSRGLCVENSQI